MPKFQQIRQNPPRSAKFRGMVHCVSCANSTNNPKFTRVPKGNRKGGKKTHTIGSRGSGGRSPNSPRTKSLPNVRPRDPQVNPMDRDPSDAMILIRVDAQRRSSSLGEMPARTGTGSESMISNSATPSKTSKLREWVRNGGRSFSRTLGSSRLYTHRLMRNIRMRWKLFKVRHPVATRYAKYVSWLSGIAVSVGSVVSLPVELYKTFHILNHTDTEIMDRIDNVTKVLSKLQEKGQEEFAEYPDQTI